MSMQRIIDAVDCVEFFPTLSLVDAIQLSATCQNLRGAQIWLFLSKDGRRLDFSRQSTNAFIKTVLLLRAPTMDEVLERGDFSLECKSQLLVIAHSYKSFLRRRRSGQDTGSANDRSSTMEKKKFVDEVPRPPFP